MLLSCTTLPWLFKLTGAGAWPLAWLAIEAVCIPLSIAAIAAARAIAEPSTRQSDAGWPWRHCAIEFTAYFFFGLGYIAYMTFMIAWVKHHTAEPARLALTTSVMWIVLGVMTLVAPLLWRGIFNERRSEEHTSELQSLMRISYAVFCLK